MHNQINQRYVITLKENERHKDQKTAAQQIRPARTASQ